MFAQVHALNKQAKQTKANQTCMHCITQEKLLGGSKIGWKIIKTSWSHQLKHILTHVYECGQEAIQAINNFP